MSPDGLGLVQQLDDVFPGDGLAVVQVAVRVVVIVHEVDAVVVVVRDLDVLLGGPIKLYQ